MKGGDGAMVQKENVNENRNAVNDVRKTVNLFSKTTVNRNQEIL